MVILRVIIYLIYVFNTYVCCLLCYRYWSKHFKNINSFNPHNNNKTYYYSHFIRIWGSEWKSNCPSHTSLLLFEPRKSGLGVQALNSWLFASWHQGAGAERKVGGGGGGRESYEGARVKEQEELLFSVCSGFHFCIQVRFYHLLGEKYGGKRSRDQRSTHLIFQRAACDSGPDHFHLHTLTELGKASTAASKRSWEV